MATNDILLKRAQNLLLLLLGDSGYDVAPANIGNISFFVATNNRHSFAVALAVKDTLKAARAGGNDFKELQKLLAMRVLQVNAFCGAKKASVVLVAPSVLGLAKTMVGQDSLTVETLPKNADTEYVLVQLRNYDPARQIAITWSIEDVQQVRPDLTDAEAWSVLKYAFRCQEDGISLPYLCALANSMYVSRLIPCTLYPAGDENNPVPGVLELSTGVVMTQSDVDDYSNNEGYTHINGHTGKVSQIRPDIPETPGEFTLEAFGDERFAAPEGFIGDYPRDEDACQALRKRLESVGPLPNITREFERETNEYE